MNTFSHRFRIVVAPVGALSVGGLAALLSVCCGATWLVTVLGVGGAIAIARLAVFAPYLWLMAFGFLVYVHVWALRSNPNCEQGCVPKQRKQRRIAAWFVTLVMLGLFVVARGWQSFVI